VNKVLQLLQEWEDRQAHGTPITPEELCKEHPDVDPTTLRRYIRDMQKLNRVLEDTHSNDTRSDKQGDNTEIANDLPGYELQGELGKGGMGLVLLALETDLQRHVAIKLLPKMANVNRFYREAQVLARLKHPNIVPIYHANLRNGQPYFAMEYVVGGNLADQVGTLSKGPIKDVIRLMSKVARAVQCAHEHGVIHRDLKPANILMDAHGEPRVTDFGLAKLHGIEDEHISKVGDDMIPESMSLTKSGSQIGTPSYMAPEQYGSDEFTQQIDIWALGVILYELLTGRRPFIGKRFEDLQPQVLHDDPPKPRSIRKEIPAALESIVLRCLKKSPAQRYRSAAELANDLDRYLQPRWTIAKLLAGAAAVALATSAVVYLSGSNPQPVAATNPTSPIPSAQEPPPDPSPAKVQYLKAVEPLLQQLKRKEKVELVKRGEKPRASLLQEGTEARINVRADDGSLTVFHPIVCYLELLPAVELERYRITAKYRHDYQVNETGRVGIYHCYHQSQKPQGTLHCFSLQAIVDPVQKQHNMPMEKPLFSSTLYGFMDYSGQMHGFREETPAFQVMPNGKPVGWHTIQLDVDHADVTTVFDGQPLGTFNLTGRELAFQSQGPQKQRELRLTPKDFRFPPHGAVGICIQYGAISVQSFTIEPLQ